MVKITFAPPPEGPIRRSPVRLGTLTFFLVFAAAAFALAQGRAPEVGKVYEVTVSEEVSTQWTGDIGVGKIGDVNFNFPKAKKGEKFKVKVTGFETNPWTNQKEAKFEKQ